MSQAVQERNGDGGAPQLLRPSPCQGTLDLTNTSAPCVRSKLRIAAALWVTKVQYPVAAVARDAAGDSGSHPQRSRAQGAAAPGERVGSAQCAVSSFMCTTSVFALHPFLALRESSWPCDIVGACCGGPPLRYFVQVCEGSGGQHCHTISSGDAAHAAGRRSRSPAAASGRWCAVATAAAGVSRARPVLRLAAWRWRNAQQQMAAAQRCWQRGSSLCVTSRQQRASKGWVVVCWAYLWRSASAGVKAAGCQK